ncbi:MAG: cytochrome C oxidase subunit IV family protein [Candidatus Kapaibacteriota bacterium]|jgi:cytochrome c oxidase subunit 4
MENNNNHSHLIPYGTYFLIWLSLISLTVLTVSVAGIDFGKLALPIALTIAAIKSALVITYFMHIKFDDKIFKVFLFVALATLTAVFVLTLSDVFYR